jgi:glutamate racemase
VLYFGDTAHVPYGGRPLEEIRGFALSICQFLVAGGAKMIVMACNISSAVAIDEARRCYPEIPIIGVIEPGSLAAINTGAERIGVLATQGTVTSGAYTRFIRSRRESASVVEVACPAFVPLVESEMIDSPEAHEASLEYLTPLAAAHATAIILGCTHYPFLTKTLEKVAASVFRDGSVPCFIDPAIETANAISRILSSRGLINGRTAGNFHAYFVSGYPEHFENNGSFFLGKPIIDARHVTLI